MHDFKYIALLTKGEREDRALSLVRSQCLKPICAAFASNLFRTASFAFMPAQVAARVRREQKWTDQAVFRVSGKLTGSSPQRLSRTNYKKYERECGKLR